MSVGVSTPDRSIAAKAAENDRCDNRPVQQFVIDGVSYEQFVAFTDALGDRYLRMSYDGVRLEIMSPSRKHERGKTLIGRLIEQLTLELDIPIESGGHTTFRNQFAERGLEPDECYWIQHATEILGVEDWKAEEHPPPDLAVEIDVSTSSVDRQAIYAKLGVPELWRFDGASLRALHLNDAGEYEPAELSRAFPFLAVADLLPFITKAPPATETEIVREFITWLRQQDLRAG
jgi:Uma2 family endonuclease